MPPVEGYPVHAGAAAGNKVPQGNACVESKVRIGLAVADEYR
jgi:hypothetical protein